MQKVIRVTYAQNVSRYEGSDRYMDGDGSYDFEVYSAGYVSHF